jgi:hypothetical protein
MVVKQRERLTNDSKSQLPAVGRVTNYLLATRQTRQTVYRASLGFQQSLQAGVMEFMRYLISARACHNI